MRKIILLMICVTLVAGFSLLYLSTNDKTGSLSNDVKNDFDVHPYALYLLYGGDYFLADSKSGIISVDADAIAKSNAVCNLEVFKKDGWTGFIRKDNGEFLDFRYKVYKKLKNTEYFIVKCTARGKGSGSFGGTLLIRKYKQKKLLYGKIEHLKLVSCEGVFDYDIKDSDLEKMLSFKIDILELD